MGNAGIGTTSPAQKLDVLGGIKLGTTSNINNVLDTQAQSGAPSGNIYWGNSPFNTSNLGTFGVASISNTDGTLTILPTTGNVTASLNLSHANTWTGAQTFNANTYFPGSGIWNTSGNVGIGTTSPSSSLQINAPNGVTGLTINGGTYGDTDLFKMVGNAHTQRLILERSGGATTFLEAGGSVGLFGTTTNHDFRIRTNYTDRMSITTAGYVGIGDISPTSLLTVGNGDLFQVNSSGDLIKIKM